MIKGRLIFTSIILLILAGIIGFIAVKHCKVPMKTTLLYSQAAQLACSMDINEQEKNEITSKDKSFMHDYRMFCVELCEKRANLSDHLPQANVEDQKSIELINQIHQVQANLEILTFKHIISIRDELPDSEKTKFIKSIQNNWSREQEHLMKVAGSLCCGSKTCKNKNAGSGTKGSASKYQEE